MDERLTLISRMVQPCTTAADIGTDHGFLICALVEQGRCKSGIAADINPQPLEKARTLIAARGLTLQVQCVCTDGLCGIGRQDAVVIAGMGGELIASIIDRWQYRVDADIRFYLQPMTKPERLREWLFKRGYCILSEPCCVAAGRPYSIIEAAYTGESIDYAPVELYMGGVQPQADSASLAYCKRVQAKLQKKVAGLVAGGIEPLELARWQALLKAIDWRVKA